MVDGRAEAWRFRRRLRISQETHGLAVGPDDNGQWVLFGAHPLVDVRQRFIASRQERIGPGDCPHRRFRRVKALRECPRDILR